MEVTKRNPTLAEKSDIQDGGSVLFRTDGTVLDLSDERYEIATALAERSWFQATASDIRTELLTLPEDDAAKNNYNGFLADLARRPDTISGVRVLELLQLPRGNFAIIPMFRVRNVAADKVYTYEYVSWKAGPLSGAKGIVFVRTGGEITHFIILRGEKFAPGRFVYDTIGGFADLNIDGVTEMIDRFKVEIQEELGVPDLVVEEARPLGSLLPDAGMTNNNPQLFGAIIDGGQASRVSRTPVNPDVLELAAGSILFDIRQLAEVCRVNDDGFFLASVVRAIVHGMIPSSTLDT